MAKRGIQPSGLQTRKKMLHAAAVSFLEKGYQNTTIAEISKAAGMATSAFFRAYADKEAVLLELVKIMFKGQFALAGKLSATNDPVMLYAAETSLQIYITEISDALRDLYVTAYTLPTTSEYICVSTAKKLETIFAAYLPDAKEKDFYELDIASSGIVRGYMQRKSDFYFTVENKISRLLHCCLKIYNVPEEKADEAVKAVSALGLENIAKEIVAETVRSLEEGTLL